FGSNFGHAVTQNLPVLVHQSISAHDINSANINDNVPVYQMDSASGPPPAQFPAVSANGTIPLRGPTNSVDPRIRPSRQRIPAIDMWNAVVQHQLTRSEERRVGKECRYGG